MRSNLTACTGCSSVDRASNVARPRDRNLLIDRSADVEPVGDDDINAVEAG